MSEFFRNCFVANKPKPAIEESLKAKPCEVESIVKDVEFEQARPFY